MDVACKTRAKNSGLLQKDFDTYFKCQSKRVPIALEVPRPEVSLRDIRAASDSTELSDTLF
jgi:hypothetical protein